MKVRARKGLTIGLMAFLTLFMIPVVKADTITATFDPAFVEGQTYDFLTGAAVANTAYASTTKMALARNDFTITVSADFSYLFFWDRYGSYLGYGTGSGVQDAETTWLGAYGLSFTPPVSATIFAVVAACGLNEDLIGSYTWLDVYDGPTYLYYEDAVLAGTLTEAFATPSYGAYTDGVITTNIGAIYSDPHYLTYVIPDAAINPGDLDFNDTFAVSDTVVTNYGYSKANLDAYKATWEADGVTTLALTNLIQNGQFLTDGNADGLADYWTRYLVDNDDILAGVQVIESNGTSDSFGISLSGYSLPITIGKYYQVGGYFNKNMVQFSSFEIPKVSTASGYWSINTTGYYSGSVNQANYTTANRVFYLQADMGTGTLNTNDLFYVDDVYLLESANIFTKAQADTALQYFGYLPYNTAYSLPDLTDGDFTESGYYTTGTNIGIGLILLNLWDLHADDLIAGTSYSDFTYWRTYWSDQPGGYFDTIAGINPVLLSESGLVTAEMSDAERAYYTALYYDAINEVYRYEWYDWAGITALNDAYYSQLYEDAMLSVERWEWYIAEGITVGNYAYYLDLYADAVAMTDRWEWYSFYGLNEAMYLATVNDYQDILAQSGVTDSFSDFQAFTFIGEFEGVDEVPADIWDTFDTMLTPTIRTLAALIVIGFAIFLMLMKGAPIAIVAIIVTILFIFFVLVEWLPVWWGLVLAGVGFVLFILPLLKGGGSSV